MHLERAKKIGRKFQNPVPTEMGGIGLILKVLPRMIFKSAETEPRQPLGPYPTDPAAYLQPPATGLRITWFGHSSLLLELDGLTLLADPVWDQRASPVNFFGPKRFFPPTLPLEDLPPIDAVLITHDHYDHLGAVTIRDLARLRPGLRWITSLGVGKILTSFGVLAANITQLDWTESTVIRPAGASANPSPASLQPSSFQPSSRQPASPEVTLTALPTRHFSGRSTSNRFETLWSAFALRGPFHNIYLGGDTGLWPGLETIGKQYGPFDLALLEIGAYDPLWHQIHLGPDGAAEAFGQLNARTLMPVHWGLFDLALHAWRQPIERLRAIAAERNLRLFQPPPGVPTDVHPDTTQTSDWYQQ